MKTFLFYDLETTGLSKSFDQILQFAGIRTDENFNEIERYEFNIALNADVIPSPYAMITHYIGPGAKGMSEYDAILQIHRIMNHPGTISLGYNTLGFDDEFLRFSFFRYLLPPYTHQYANQCSRMDLYPMTVMYYLFKNEVLSWPMINDKISLKLENLSKANNLAKGRAHDAMVDVLATLQLAKIFFAEREMWNYLAGHFNKAIDTERTEALKNQTALLFDGFIGADNYFHCPALFIGQHRHYKNQSLWLRLDTENLTNTEEAIAQSTYVIQKKMGEPSFILPMKERFLKHLNEQRLSISQKHHDWLLKNPERFRDIAEHYVEFKHPTYANTDVDASLYLTGFKTFAEEKLCQAFHAANPKEKAKIQEKTQHGLLRTQMLRVLGRHFQDELTPAQKDDFEGYLQSVKATDEERALIDFQGKKRLTPSVALRQIGELRGTEINDEQRLLLDELEDYLKS